MNEFKFNCPKCGQHILTNASWIGRRINCPSCDTRIAIPAPAKPQKKDVPVVTPPKVTKPTLLPGGLRVEPPAKADKNRTASAKKPKQAQSPAATPTIPKSGAPAVTAPVQPRTKSDIAGGAEKKAPHQTPPPTAAPADAKAKLPGDTLPVAPPVKTAKTVPAKATKETEAAAAAPAVAKPKLPPSGPRVEPPVQTDKNQMSPAKQSKPVEPPATAPVARKSKLPSVAIPPTADQRLQSQVKSDKAQAAPAKAPSQTESASVAPAVDKAKPATPPLRVELPVKAEKTHAAPAPTPQPAPKVAETGKPEATPPQPESGAAPDAAQPPEQPRVAVLTPAVKLDMVRAVRRRIAEESAWLPGKVEGTAAYAAKMSEGKPVLLEVKSSEATRFSLMGSFLLEMHVRQVIPTAGGRKKFLDQEIPDAIGEMLLNEMSEEEREHVENPLADKDPLSISHAQCLAALDVMEERYSERLEQLRIEKAKKRIGNVRLPDLVKKLEKKARILPEDVATALYHEIMKIRRRLEKLENRGGGQMGQP